MQVYKFDNDGYYIEPVILEEGESLPTDCTEKEPPIPNWKPRWDGSKWVETGSPVPHTQTKSELEILRETVDMLVLESLKGV